MLAGAIRGQRGFSAADRIEDQRGFFDGAIGVGHVASDLREADLRLESADVRDGLLTTYELEPSVRSQTSDGRQMT